MGKRIFAVHKKTIHLCASLFHMTRVEQIAWLQPLKRGCNGRKSGGSRFCNAELQRQHATGDNPISCWDSDPEGKPHGISTAGKPSADTFIETHWDELSDAVAKPR
jgi:hypothetical protein